MKVSRCDEACLGASQWTADQPSHSALAWTAAFSHKPRFSEACRLNLLQGLSYYEYQSTTTTTVLVVRTVELSSPSLSLINPITASLNCTNMWECPKYSPVGAYSLYCARKTASLPPPSINLASTVKGKLHRPIGQETETKCTHTVVVTICE